MTIPLSPLHPLDELYHAANQYPGGIEALAERLGTSRAMLYNKLRQGVTSHYLHYDDELSELLFCLSEARVQGWSRTLVAICWRHGHMAVPLPTTSTVADGEMDLELVSSQIKSNADALSSYIQAIADGKVTQTELQKVEDAAATATQSMMRILQIARTKHHQHKVTNHN